MRRNQWRSSRWRSVPLDVRKREAARTCTVVESQAGHPCGATSATPRTVVEAQAERTAALDIHDARCVAEPSSGRETSSCSTLSGGEVLMPPRRLLHRAASTASMPPPTLKAN